MEGILRMRTCKGWWGIAKKAAAFLLLYLFFSVFCPRQQRLQFFIVRDARQGCKHVAQIVVRLKSIGLCRFNQTVQ